MIIGRVTGATRVLGKSQGYRGLPIRDEIVDGTSYMVSVWLPTPAEIEAINAGAPVMLRMMGTVHPPVRVDVGERPEAT